MGSYRCYYVRHPIYVGMGSRLVGEQYQRVGDWPTSTLVWEQGYGLPDAPPQLFTIDRLHDTHVVVRKLEADTMEEVYGLMQADGWTHAEILGWNQHIRGLGLTHASMSVGDVVEDIAAQRYFECEMLGWRELAQE